jgi:pyruvate/2-oxoglutarate dehydrogenase complex dihydrolipoamide dehydrogenase (E3) component
MTEQLDPAVTAVTLCVIGASPGGLAAVLGAVTLGAKVVLIEKGKLGVERVAAGEVPAKALAGAARRADALRTSAPFGIKPPKTSIEFHEINDHVRRVVEAVAPNETKERLTALGVQVIEGEAQFRNAATVAVGDIEIKAQHFVIALPSIPALPVIEGLEQTPYFTSDSIFETRVRPKQLIVIGAGATGLELAQAFRRLGSDVTVLDQGPPLPDEDTECAGIVLDALAREGVMIRARVTIARVRRFRSKIEVTLAGENGEEVVEGSDLLIAAGRRHDFSTLNLDAAGIGINADGIAVDHRCRTSNKQVYAIGGIAPHLAEHQAGIVLRHSLLGETVNANAEPVPRLVLTEPELAHVGLTDVQLALRRRPIRVLRWPYNDNVRAQAERQTTGQIKAIVDKKGKILGVTIVGAASGEQIVPWILAIRHGLDVRAFAGIVVPSSVYTEIGKRVAFGFSCLRLTAKGARRVLRWLGLG